MSEPKEEPEVQLLVNLKADFCYKNTPVNDEEKASRELTQKIVDTAAKRLVPIVHKLVVEMLDAQRQHYIKVNK